MYEVSISRGMFKPEISTRASSLREVKSLISGLKPRLHVKIKDLKSGEYIYLNSLKFWSDNKTLFCQGKTKLSKGIRKSGFIKD